MTEREITFTNRTSIKCSDADIEKAHLKLLKEQAILSDVEFLGDDSSQIDEVDIDIKRLVDFVYRYTTLDETSGHAQVAALHYFKENSINQATTQQVTDGTDFSKSSISRALNRLEKEGLLNRVQNGVYELP
jgi:hypothetical protein